MRNEHLALLSSAVYLLVVSLGRGLLQWRWTGSFGFRPLGRGAPAAAWIAKALFASSLLSAAAAVWLQLYARVAPLPLFDFSAARPLALTLFALGFAGTSACQLGMGRSWRIGVDPTERTDLVTTGLYRHVRHPIYTSVFVTAAGLALLVPNAIALAALALLVAALLLQTRGVEEPHLERMHGEHYRAYAARSGRFLPWIGRVRA